jgi:hypothetical protein
LFASWITSMSFPASSCNVKMLLCSTTCWWASGTSSNTSGLQKFYPKMQTCA